MNEILIKPEDVDLIAQVNSVEGSHAPLHALLNEEFQLKRKAAAVYINEPVATDCHTQFHAVHSSGRRPLSVIDLIVEHCTQGSTAQGAASYSTNAAAGGSFHLTVDDNTCYRCLSDDVIPWGAPGANYNGLHIEQAGYVTWTTYMWNTQHRRTLNRAAYKTAYHCKKYGIEVRFLTAANLRAGMRNGITTHWECTQAFGGDHTDPGKGWPRAIFMTRVRAYYSNIEIPRIA